MNFFCSLLLLVYFPFYYNKYPIALPLNLLVLSWTWIVYFRWTTIVPGQEACLQWQGELFHIQMKHKATQKALKNKVDSHYLSSWKCLKICTSLSYIAPPTQNFLKFIFRYLFILSPKFLPFLLSNEIPTSLCVAMCPDMQLCLPTSLAIKGSDPKVVSRCLMVRLPEKYFKGAESSGICCPPPFFSWCLDHSWICSDHFATMR